MRYIAALFLLLMLAACAPQEPVCSDPYILQSGKCCLDANGDDVCDSQAPTGQLDCSLCPPQFVTQKEEVIVYKYVCMNQSVVDKPEDCGEAITSNAHLFSPRTEQDETFIETFDVDAACRGRFQAAELHLEYAQTPLNISIQVLDDPEGEFRTVDMIEVIPETFYYIGFCLDCQNLIDLQLAPNQAYMVRAMLQYEDQYISTAEYVIDPTPNGNIGRKVCS